MVEEEQLPGGPGVVAGQDDDSKPGHERHQPPERFDPWASWVFDGASLMYQG
jgi:hypothetical protein